MKPGALRSLPHPSSCSIRRVVEADLARLAHIEVLSYPDPWSAQMLGRELSLPHSRGLAALDEQGGVVAYCFYWRAHDEGEIHSLTTHPDYRRRGIARHLAAAALKDLAGNGARAVYLEVREGNAAAVGLYRSIGFEVKSVRKRYYGDGENALVMAMSLGGAANR